MNSKVRSMTKIAIIVLKLVPEADREGGNNKKIAKEIRCDLEERALPWQGEVERVLVGDAP